MYSWVLDDAVAAFCGEVTDGGARNALHTHADTPVPTYAPSVGVPRGMYALMYYYVCVCIRVYLCHAYWA